MLSTSASPRLRRWRIRGSDSSSAVWGDKPLQLHQTDPRGKDLSLKRVEALVENSTVGSTVIYWQHDSCGVDHFPGKGQLPFREVLQAERTEEAGLHHRRFEVSREVHKVLNFRLVLCGRRKSCSGGKRAIGV